MGPKKEPRKKEPPAKTYSIDDPINTGNWNCVVAMAVEKSSSDNFILKAFQDEAVKNLRQQVKLINYETFVIKILNEFANGELPHKFAFLLNFSSVFQEAAACLTNKTAIPVPLLAKVVKGLLFYLKEESLARAERKISGPIDPVKDMAERPANGGGTVGVGGKSRSKKEAPGIEKKKKQTANDKLTVRPPSMSKQDTKLLKRGEGLKEDQGIDDAPEDGFFYLYVLLTGFYHPELPLELIKADVPLYVLLCVDTSQAEVRKIESPRHSKTQKRNSEVRTEEIQKFWDAFLEILWNPEDSLYFNDTIFQVYVPKKLTCDNFKEFIYREISYLMYDVSDLRKQLGSYLQHMKVWDVRGEETGLLGKYIVRMSGLDVECTTVSIILRRMIEVVSEEDSSSFGSVDTISEVVDSSPHKFSASKSMMAKRGSKPVSPVWSQLLSNDEELSIYNKMKELDILYNLGEDCMFGSSSYLYEEEEGDMFCGGPDEMFATRWKSIRKPSHSFLVVDYSLYPLLLPRVLCSYDNPADSFLAQTSSTSTMKNLNFQQIQNLDDEMRNPHFTVTQGSRSIINGTPFNIKEASRDFFSPLHFKLVTPEKMKASSAPEFRSGPKSNHRISFVSELTYPLEYLKKKKLTVFEKVRSFIGEGMFEKVKGYDFLEELNATHILNRESEYMNSYNCVDCSYAIIADALLVVFHNRKNSDGALHETFNAVLKTEIGLRDFYDYTLEDEADWLKQQQDLPWPSLTLTNTISEDHVVTNYTDSDFWLERSIKYQEYVKSGSRRYTKEVTPVTDQEDNLELPSQQSLAGELDESSTFHGYNVSKAAVQFSGLKTVYYGKDCSVAVELLERLYGDQHLGVHVFQNEHCLHLYSYVCPKPHLNLPNTFHVTVRSGILIAFSKRLIEVVEEVEEIVKSKISIDKSKKSTSAVSTSETIKRKIEVQRTIEDEEFPYDMKLSLPNGLALETVRGDVKPCHIKQTYMDAVRLFLPNGNVVEIKETQVVILKADATTITTSFHDVSKNYQITTPDGVTSTMQNGTVVFRRKLSFFQNTDLETNTTYFRRGDGTSFMLQKDGTMCTRFKDGTKISTTPFVEDYSDDSSDSILEDSDFVFIQMEVTVEHPDYATVIYNTQDEIWKILLPFKTTIVVRSGSYNVQLDEETELRVDPMEVEMRRHHPEGEASMVADFSAFDDDRSTYCRMTDSCGKTFVVEPNSNCYVVDEEEYEREVVQEEKSEMSRRHSESENALSRDSKYLVLRREGSGFELLHQEDFRKLLANPTPGMVVFVPEITDSPRIFVLISTAAPPKRGQKWMVESILPDPKFVPRVVKTEITSTYGVPPSWMHPFPKRKKKIEIPSQLSCRVFLEINKTDIQPPSIPLSSYCEVDDAYTELPKLKPNQIQELVRKLTDNDQDLLREMYVTAIKTALNDAKPKARSEASEALKFYLMRSEQEVALQKYHEKCIRYHIVPNYFHHPIGMSWLILNGIVDRMAYPEDDQKRPVRSRLPSPPSFESESTFSNEEIEYDLVTGSEQSYSDLSCRTDLSIKSAPTVLIKGNVCTCKFKAAVYSESAPIYKMKNRMSSESRMEMPRKRSCGFEADEMGRLDGKKEETTFLNLSDLMSLGLI